MSDRGMLAGVDGCPGGWVAAIDRGDGTTAVEEFPSFAHLLTRVDVATIVVDIPIGLLSTGSRQADLLARRRLGAPRASSVFPAPLRPLLAASTWEQACAIRFAIEGKKCQKQLFNILPKIREVDALLDPALQERVFEGHPEVCFTLMNEGLPLIHPKRVPSGRQERLILLDRHFPDARARLSQHRRNPIDVIDAYACLWTARRVARGEEIRLPAEPELDDRGLRAEIVS